MGGSEPLGEMTVSRLARRCGLCRSTLLYYDAMGLLVPRSRTEAGYRRYDEADAARLERIRVLREAGLSLAQIRQVLDAPASDPAKLLEERLRALATEMGALRRRQRVLLRLLEETGTPGRPLVPDKEAWVGLLRDAGLSEEEQVTLHACFEARMPEGHQDFLESLGLDEQEIRRIREGMAPKTGRGEAEGSAPPRNHREGSRKASPVDR